MPHPDGAVRLDRDSPDLARVYDETSVVQFDRGQSLIAPLGLKPGEHVLDIGAGTGRLAVFVASLVGPSGRVVGIDPLDHRIDLGHRGQSPGLSFEIGAGRDDVPARSSRSFAARYAEAIFTAHQTLKSAKEFHADIKQRAGALGRRSDEIKALRGISPFVASTQRRTTSRTSSTRRSSRTSPLTSCAR